MSQAAWLAAAAASAGVVGTWEALAAVERTRVAAATTRLLEPLRRAGSEGRAPTLPERRRLAALAAGVLLAAGWLVGGLPLGVLCALTGPAVVVGVIGARRRRWRDDLRRAAPTCARVMADSLSAGRSVRAALGDAAAGVEGGARHELGIAARALALGEPTETVLLRLRTRARAHAWDTLVAAILLQRDAGGDLASLLRELAAAGEAAERAGRDARTATAQARFTAWLVLGLPSGAAVLAELGSPGFVAGLVAAPLSVWLAGTAVLLQVAALVCVLRLARASSATAATTGGSRSRRPS
jgi:tight adherence protein B